MVDITFCIPIGPNHVALSHRAIESVKAQTVECKWLAMQDEERRGPGYLRNRMLERVDTEFVSFLDADDWLEPTFAADTIAEYRRIGGNRYIYTDWLDVNFTPIETPCLNGPNGVPISVTDRKPYCGGTWHVLTTLIPTSWAREVGGFNEQLPAAEDTDFYLKLCTSMRCGHRLAKPLFHYSLDGTRAKDFHAGPDYHNVMGAITEQYGGKMGCCGDNDKIVSPIGQRQEGDVQAMALWHGNRTEYGRITGRTYARISFPKSTWVDPRDVAQSPALWKLLEAQPVNQTEGLTQLSQIAQMAIASIPPRPAAPVAEPPAPPVAARPDIKRVINLAKQTGDPVFVFSEKQYPSYSDIRRLVELSGYKSITTKQIDAFSRAPYIVVSPEPVPDLNGLKARVICWQLEYAGDYTNNYDGFTGEMWASDKAWADEHGAKYVLMGSHLDLKFGPAIAAAVRYDVTMLGYMTPRRQSIKDKLSALKWPEDYPGHGTEGRDLVLQHTHVMLHVHQHNGQPFCAPQRIAIAAAYHMPVVSEAVRDAGALADVVTYASYVNLPAAVNRALKSNLDGFSLHDYLCIEHSFDRCVEEALK